MLRRYAPVQKGIEKARKKEEQTTDRYKQSKYIQKFIPEKKRENSRRRRDPER